MAGEGKRKSLVQKLSGLFSGGRKKEEPERPAGSMPAADGEDLFSPVGETGTGFNFVLKEPEEVPDSMDEEEDDPDRTRKYDPIRMH